LGTGADRRVFPQLFPVLSISHECFYNSKETQITCFLFPLENSATKKKENSLFTLILLMPPLHQQLMLVLRFYQVLETQFLTNH